jgi:hypothetical protein
MLWFGISLDHLTGEMCSVGMREDSCCVTVHDNIVHFEVHVFTPQAHTMAKRHDRV